MTSLAKSPEIFLNMSHVEENFKRHLRQVICEGDSNYETVINDIVGTDGQLYSRDHLWKSESYGIRGEI